MRLLVETHFPATCVEQLQRHGIDAVALQRWRDSVHRTAGDDVLLAAAYTEQRIIVTRDVRTFPLWLKQWGDAGRHHAGVILVSDHAFPPADVGRLLRSLVHLVETSSDEPWEDRIVYLKPIDT